MTREDIIRMARESGFCFNIDDPVVYAAHEHLAALHAAHERERIIAANAPEIEKVNAHIKALEDRIAAATLARVEP